MENADQPDHGREPPGDRLSRLSQASLRINESLDVDAALPGSGGLPAKPNAGCSFPVGRPLCRS